MTKTLDLADIQGNILQDFGRGFPTARFFFLRLSDRKPGEPDAAAGRNFILAYRSKITTALPWGPSKNYPNVLVTKRPTVAINIAFTFRGLLALKLPIRTLAKLPAEFIDRMKARAAILGDDANDSDLKNWDPIWSEDAHIMVGLNAPMDPATGQAVAELQQESDYLTGLCAKYQIKIMRGHGPGQANYQDASALTQQAPDGTFKPRPFEHFGLRDAIGEPFIDGQVVDSDESNPVGGGKILGEQW